MFWHWGNGCLVSAKAGANEQVVQPPEGRVHTAIKVSRRCSSSTRLCQEEERLDVEEADGRGRLPPSLAVGPRGVCTEGFHSEEAKENPFSPKCD